MHYTSTLDIFVGRAGETSVSSIVTFERQTRPKSTTLANYWVSFGPEPPYLKARL